MDKEKAYDEALSVARKTHQTQPMYRDWLEKMFPQLAESEDERISGTIFNCVYQCCDDGFISVEQRNDAIAWLEKQGEPTEINPSEFDSQLNRLLKQFESLSKEDLASSLSFYLNVVQNDGTYKEEKQSKQKPAELGENRSKELSLSLQIQAYLNTVSDELYAKGKPLYSEEKLEDIHKCMLMWQKLHNAYFYQKPWSKEDERMIGNIQRIIEQYAFSKSAVDVNGELCEKEFIDADNWLKSLRPQSQWKPSEEQMEALYTYIYNPQYFNSPDPRMELVESVYKDLKKLKDE